MYRAVLALMLGLDAGVLAAAPPHWTLPLVPMRHPAFAQYAWKLLARCGPGVQVCERRSACTVSRSLPVAVC